MFCKYTLLNAFVDNGVELGVTDGVTDGVIEGVTLTLSVIDGVTLGVIDGVTLTLGVIDGVILGVIDGDTVIDGVTLGVTLGVTVGVGVGVTGVVSKQNCCVAVNLLSVIVASVTVDNVVQFVLSDEPSIVQLIGSRVAASFAVT